MRAIRIPASESHEIRRIDVPDALPNRLTGLQSQVGGLIELIPWDRFPEASLFINEEGKLTGQPRNVRLTDALRADKAIFPHDWVAGDAVIVGFQPRTGDARSLTLDECGAILGFLAPVTA